MQETWVQSLGQEDSLEKGMATNSSTPAWRIPGIGEPAGYSPQGHKEWDTTEWLSLFPGTKSLSPTSQTFAGYRKHPNVNIAPAKQT